MLRPERAFYLRRRVVLGAAGAIVVLWLGSVGGVLSWAVQDDGRKADATALMAAAQYQGKPSPVLRARLDHALASWQGGFAPRLLLTGGIGEGDPESEAAGR